MEILAASLSGSQGEGALTLSTGVGSITVPSDMLAWIQGVEGKKAAITVGQGSKSGLPDETRAAVGDRPVLHLTLTLDGSQTEWKNQGAPVKVSIHYTPTSYLKSWPPLSISSSGISTAAAKESRYQMAGITPLPAP